MDKKQEEDFYRELDDHQLNLNKGCQKVFVFFLIILIVGGLIVFYLTSKLRNYSNLTYSNIPIATDIETVNGSEQEIIITDLQINNFLDNNQKNIPIQYLKGNISPEGIAFKGIWQALDSRIELLTLPKVEESKIDVEVVSVRIGSIGVPSWFGGQISSMVEKVIAERLPKNSKVTQCVLTDGQITIKVQNE